MEIAVRQDTFRGAQEARVTLDWPTEMQLIGGIGKRLAEVELTYGSRAHE
jgi:hypothetical protein